MNKCFCNGMTWVSVEEREIEKTRFVWGEKVIEPGHLFDKIGSKERSSFDVSDCKIEYCGRKGTDLYFSLVKECGKKSSDDKWFVVLSYVNNLVLLAQTAPNGFYDIRN